MEVRPREPFNLFEEAQEQKRRIETRNVRVEQEIEQLRESIVGAGPEQDVQRTIEKISARMDSLRPLTEAEYRRRRDKQKRELEKALGHGGL